MALYFPAGKEPTCRSSNHKGLLARYNIVVLGGVAKRWSRKTPSLAKPRRIVKLKSRENLKSWATRDREDVSSRERENEIYIVIVKFSTKENVSHQRLCDSNTIKSTTTREIFSHQRELKKQVIRERTVKNSLFFHYFTHPWFKRLFRERYYSPRRKRKSNPQILKSRKK